MRNSLSNKKAVIGAASVALFFCLWALASRRMGSDQILPGPWATLIATLELFSEKDFLLVVGSTVFRG